VQRRLPRIKVVEFLPDVFHNIRTAFGVNTLAFRASLGMLDWTNIEQSLSPAPLARAPDLKLVGQADAAGKSSAWFFFSSDQRYMVKIATELEKELLLDIVEGYYRRVMDSMPEADEDGRGGGGGGGLPRTLLPR
jgi:hypothetical protein